MPSSITAGKPFTYFLLQDLSETLGPMTLIDCGAGLATYPKLLRRAVPNGTRFIGIEI